MFNNEIGFQVSNALVRITYPEIMQHNLPKIATAVATVAEITFDKFLQPAGKVIIATLASQQAKNIALGVGNTIIAGLASQEAKDISLVIGLGAAGFITVHNFLRLKKI